MFFFSSVTKKKQNKKKKKKKKQKKTDLEGTLWIRLVYAKINCSHLFYYYYCFVRVTLDVKFIAIDIYYILNGFTINEDSNLDDMLLYWGYCSFSIGNKLTCAWKKQLKWHVRPAALRIRSTSCPYAKSYKGLYCSRKESLRPQVPIECIAQKVDARVPDGYTCHWAGLTRAWKRHIFEDIFSSPAYTSPITSLNF